MHFEINSSGTSHRPPPIQEEIESEEEEQKEGGEEEEQKKGATNADTSTANLHHSNGSAGVRQLKGWEALFNRPMQEAAGTMSGPQRDPETLRSKAEEEGSDEIQFHVIDFEEEEEEEEEEPEGRGEVVTTNRLADGTGKT